MEPATILLLDLDPDDRIGARLRELSAEGQDSPYRFEERCLATRSGAASGKELDRLLDSVGPDLVFLGIGDAGRASAESLVRELLRHAQGLPILAAMRDWDVDPVLALLKQGWFDFVTLPLRPLDVFPRIRRMLSWRHKDDAVLGRLKERLGLRRMIGANAGFLEEMRKVPAIARCDATVLVTGETGTGKEMCARAIHYLSPRSEKPFVGVNCGAVPADLIENELFGHEREAFTGASSHRPGLLQECDTGTLFLDEVDSLPLSAQVKLLRFLQEKEYRALGSVKTLKADVRVIAAANVDLERAVAEGRIRRDLYYRLNIVSVNLPPLRDRKDDIPALLDHFLVKYAREYRAGHLEVGQEARRRILSYAWPGNIRQLEHAVQRAVLLASGQVLTASDFNLPGDAEEAAEEPFGVAKARMIRNFERDYIRNLLMVHKGNISQAARMAHKDRRAFFHLVRKHGIAAETFRVAGAAGAAPEGEPGERD
jgi:DNA-binding NtrC family response regulator